MPMMLIESAQEFIARHGGDPIQRMTSEGGERHQTTRLMLPDGAEIDMDDVNIRREPRTDPMEKLKGVIAYLRLKLDRENERYRACQAYISTQSQFHAMGAGPLPHPDSYEDLKKLQLSHREIQRQLGVKETELQELRGPDQWQLRQAERDQQRAAAASALADMAAIVGNPPPANPLARIEELVQQERKLLTGALARAAGIRPDAEAP